MATVESTDDLRKVLLETIESVKVGSMSPQSANAIANLTGKVIQSAKLDLEFLRLGNTGEVEIQSTRLITKSNDPS